MRKSHNNKLKLFWATQTMGDGIGNAFGYMTHNKHLRRYVARIAELTPDAKCALVITSPEMYNEPPEGYVNFLFTMFEGTTLPDIYVENMKKANYLIAPSTWVKEKFDQYFPPEYTFVCPHGVEPVYSYHKRSLPKRGEPFIYLWVGAPNPRKGYEELIVTWKHFGFINDRSALLYVKTTRVEGTEQKCNVFLDGRKLTLHQLVNVYKRAHCFVMPSRGEGFGLTAIEAMRTGLPCIATDYSGMRDFFDADVGYPVSYDMAKGTVMFPGTKMKHDTEVAMPKVEEIAEKMIWIRQNYAEALKKGWEAHKRIASQFTWPRSAKILVDGIRGKIES